MYNAAQKQRFIDSLQESYKMRALFLFGLSEEYELSNHLDIACMRSDQIDLAIQPKTDSSTSSMASYARTIAQYKQWCNAQNLPYAFLDETLTIETSSLKTSRYLFSATQLQHILNQVLAPVESKTPDNFPRAACWLAFSGINPELCDYITPATINFENATITLADQTFFLAQESLSSFRSLCYDTAFTTICSTRQSTAQRPVPQSDESIFRGTRSSASGARSRLSNWRRILKQRTLNTQYADLLIFENLRISGLCALIHQECLSVPPADRAFMRDDIIKALALKDYELQSALNLSAKTATRRTQRDFIYRRVAKYTNEYKTWQQAFSEWLAFDNSED